MRFRELYEADIARFGKEGPSAKMKRFYYFFRKAQTANNPIARLYYRFWFKKVKEKQHIELYAGTKVGKGLYIGHPYCITINPDVKIGENVNIHKGVTIGQENRGTRKGTPVIGNQVWNLPENTRKIMC